MKKLKLIILLLFFGYSVFAAKVATLNDLSNPVRINADNTQIYITEGATIFIYSLKDFKLKKKFGKKGQGPQEFLEWSDREGITVTLQADHIVVGSRGKVSFFTLDGTYDKQIKTTFGRKIKPFGKKFVGYESNYDKDQTLFNTIYLYDAASDKLKEIYKKESFLQLRRGKGFLFFSSPFDYFPYEDKIFVIGEKNFVIDVFDGNGEKINSIKKEYERIKITEAHKEEALNYFKTDPLRKDRYPWVKKNIRFPDYFPAIRSLNLADKKIYVRTYKKDNENTEFFIFDTAGKLLKKVFLPISEMNGRDSYPFTINNGTLYQLIEHPETGDYELHVTEIEQ